MPDAILPFNTEPYDALPVSAFICKPVVGKDGSRDFQIVYANGVFAKNWRERRRGENFVGTLLGGDHIVDEDTVARMDACGQEPRPITTTMVFASLLVRFEPLKLPAGQEKYWGFLVIHLNAEEDAEAARVHFLHAIRRLGGAAILIRVHEGRRFESLYVSQEYADMMEDTVEHSLYLMDGPQYQETTHPDDRHLIAYMVTHCHAPDGGPNIQARKITSKGNVIWCNIHYSFLDYLGERYMYITYFDITAFKEAREAAARAEKANTAKSEFLANMSHEIRTPINAILGMNEMIIRESRDERVTTYARNVESAGKNLLSIINDILDFSKIEAGKMEIANADYKLSSVLNDVTNMIAFKARQKDLTFNVNVDETLPDGLYGDEVRVRQVIVNILNNAVKYTREGSVTFQAGGERKGDGTLELVFRVTDTGIGIKEEDLPKLFSKFTRVDLAQNNTVEGTGLGLSITQNLLKLMNGTVEVESEYSKGSTFTIRIPQKIVSDEPIGNFQEKFEQYVHKIRGYRESFRAPEARVLVVDDTDMNLTVATGLLSKTEVQLDTASSGGEALKLAKEHAYDLILMDQRMPQMDGTEAMQRIRAQEGGLNHQTPIICLTADAVTGARAKYLEEGFTDYLSKPIEGAALETALIKYLPPEKVAVQGVLDEEPKEEQKEQPQSELAAFYEKAEGLDYVNAVRCCSSEAILEKTLEQFYRSITPGADAIEGFFKEKDYKNYTIKVHALKSSARLIGADELSEEAKFLEECGNNLSEASLEQIEERTPKLLADYRGLLKTLAPLYAAEEAARASAPEIEPEMLNEAYEAIREFAESFDSDAIDGILAELRQYRIPESEAAQFEAIETAARNMDWNGLKAALSAGA